MIAAADGTFAKAYAVLDKRQLAEMGAAL